MVDGINTKNPSLPATGEKGDIFSRTVGNSNKSQQNTPPKSVSGTRDIVAESISSEISKAAGQRIVSLSGGDIQDFQNAAEKFITASLPSPPPGTRLRIEVDDGSGRFVYQSIDIETGDVLNQFPAEEILKQLAFLRERNGVEGIVVDETV